MSNIIKLWLFTLCFLVAEYAVGTDDCINPGLNNEITGVNIEISVREPSDGDEIYWVDSGEVISKKEQKSGNQDKITFTVDGVINLCPINNESKTLVPATFCNEDRVPDYNDAKNIENAGDDLGRDLKGVCRGKNINNKRRYVDTGIKVNTGDKLSFSLIPRQIKIACENNLFGQKITLDEIPGDNGKTIDFYDICNGRFNCSGEGKNSQFESLNKKSYDVLVGNGYTPYDNKVYRDFNFSKFNTSGALLDLRRCPRKKLIEIQSLPLDEDIRDEIATSCSNSRDKQECIKRTEEERRKMMKKKYSVYELNCFENNICYNQSGIGSKCFSSIRYQKYDRNNRCDMDAYLAELEEKMKTVIDKIGTDNQKSENDIMYKAENLSWAESLVAKIGSSNKEDLLLGSEGSQCFPEKNNKKCALIEDNSDFKKFSLQLDHEYTVDEVNHKTVGEVNPETVGKVNPNNSVMLAIAGKENDRYDLYRGGYYVKTRKSCNFTKGEKLYLYIGNDPPKKINSLGDSKMFYHIGGELKSSILLKDGTEKNGNIIYAIDKSKLANDKENKIYKIYFGIDVRNAVRDDLISGGIHNKYTVSMSVGSRVNDYVSSTVNGILQYVKATIGGKEIIKGTYTGFATGLLSLIRTLLTLYIVFSVIGYMLGTVQLGINDFIIRIVKIACVVLATSESSWKFFGENLYTLFIDGSAQLIDGFAGYGAKDQESGKIFGFLDETVGVLFSAGTWLKFLSLVLAGPFGFVAFLGIIWASVIFLKCMIIAIVKYVIATVLVGFLLALAPLFIVFVLFQTTSKLFTGWIQLMAGVSLQPVIAFSLLSLLSKLLYPIFYNITNFSACYECLFSLNIPGNPCIIKAIWPSGYDPNVSMGASSDIGGTLGSLPIDVIQALIYFILANVIDNFVGMSETIAESVFGSVGVRQLVSGVADSASQSVLSMVGLDQGTQREIASIRRTEHDSLLARTGRTGIRMNFSNEKDENVSGGSGAGEPAKKSVKNVNQDRNSG